MKIPIVYYIVYLKFSHPLLVHVVHVLKQTSITIGFMSKKFLKYII